MMLCAGLAFAQTPQKPVKNDKPVQAARSAQDKDVKLEANKAKHDCGKCPHSSQACAKDKNANTKECCTKDKAANNLSAKPASNNHKKADNKVEQKTNKDKTVK